MPQGHALAPRSSGATTPDDGQWKPHSTTRATPGNHTPSPHRSRELTDPADFTAFDALPPAVKRALWAAGQSYSAVYIASLLARVGEQTTLHAIAQSDQAFAQRGLVPQTDILCSYQRKP